MSNIEFSDPNSSNYIEPGIRPVCDVLNAIPGVRTVYSCEGHINGVSQPYVMFEAPVDVALKIHNMLGIGGHADGTLIFYWWIYHRFHENEGKVRYILEPLDFRIPLSPWSIKSWLLRLKIKDELKQLAKLIRHTFV